MECHNKPIVLYDEKKKKHINCMLFLKSPLYLWNTKRTYVWSFGTWVRVPEPACLDSLT